MSYFTGEHQIKIELSCSEYRQLKVVASFNENTIDNELKLIIKEYLDSYRVKANNRDLKNSKIIKFHNMCNTY